MKTFTRNVLPIQFRRKRTLPPFSTVKVPLIPRPLKLPCYSEEIESKILAEDLPFLIAVHFIKSRQHFVYIHRK